MARHRKSKGLPKPPVPQDEAARILAAAMAGMEPLALPALDAIDASDDAPPTARPKKRSKYRNVKVEVNGVRFDSRKEAARWQQLQAREAAGEIHGLDRQVPFSLVVNGQLVAKYVADAVYYEDGVRIVEDTKSPITRKNPVYRLKCKLVKALLGIEIREV